VLGSEFPVISPYHGKPLFENIDITVLLLKAFGAKVFVCHFNRAFFGIK